MKKTWRFLVAVMAVAIAIAGGVIAFNRPGSVVLRSNSTVFDFGVVSDGGESQAFEVTNESTRDVLIEKLETTCACVEATVAEKMLRPGESTEVTVSFHPLPGGGVSRAKIVLIESTSFVTHEVMEVMGRGSRMPSAHPPRIDFGDVPSKSKPAETRVVRLVALSHGTPAITVNDLCKTRFDAELVSLKDGSQGLKVKVRDGSPGGLFNGTASVDLSYPSGAALNVPIIGKTSSTTCIKPSSLTFLTLPQDHSHRIEAHLNICPGKIVDSVSVVPHELSSMFSFVLDDSRVSVSVNAILLNDNSCERCVLIVSFNDESCIAIPVDLWVGGAEL